MKIYIEKQFGVTDSSLEYLQRILPRLRKMNFELVEVTISRFAPYGFQVYGLIEHPSDTWQTSTIDYDTWKESVVILLGGLNCGYSGTAPHGSVKALKILGVNVDRETEHKIFTHQLCHYHVRGGWTFV